MTEEWVKKRANISSDELDDVKTLSLPGTYHEKISSIGNALQQFTRLKHLDLSKNNISSLKGLEHLRLLETLNLYYNKVSDMKEIFRIRNCQNILNMDLRLNPVTGNEPDYRLFIAHMLPKLQRLDDRPLRDSERKSALLHFSSADVSDSMLIREMNDEQQRQQADSASSASSSSTRATNHHQADARSSRQPRVDHVKNMVRKPTFVCDEDTVTDVIDYVEKTGSGDRKASARPSSKMHTKQELLEIVRKESELYKKQLEREKQKQEVDNSGDQHQRQQTNGGDGLSVIRKNFECVDQHRQFADEDTAYHQYRSTANFTPHPGTDQPPPTVLQQNKSKKRPQQKHEVTSEHTSSTTSDMEDDEYRKLPEKKTPNFGESTTNQEQQRCKNLNQIKFLESILDLVDRYWNGSESLHHHDKFHARAQGPIDKFLREMSSSKDAHAKVLQDKVNAQQRDISHLKQKLNEAKKQQQQLSTVDPKELDSVKARANAANSDNKILRSKIAQLENKVQECEEKYSGDGERVAKLEQQKKELVQQVASLKINLEQQERNNQLTSMLQDSHKSLVASNSHLLEELEDLKLRHRSEVDQLKWTYDQLRKTSKITNGHNYSDSEF